MKVLLLVLALLAAAHAAVIVPVNGTAGDEFGYAVALSGTSLLIGSPGYSNVSADLGAVYLYRFAGTWTLFSMYAGPDAYIRLGEAVVFWGDRIVVGVPFAENGVEDVGGQIYIFNSNLTLETLAAAPKSTDGGRFGCALAADERLYVSECGEQKVRVFDSAIQEVYTLDGPPSFGSSLAVGNLLAVGAPAGDGAVFLYQNETLVANYTGTANASLGTTLAAAGGLYVAGAPGASYVGLYTVSSEALVQGVGAGVATDGATVFASDGAGLVVRIDVEQARIVGTVPMTLATAGAVLALSEETLAAGAPTQSASAGAVEVVSTVRRGSGLGGGTIALILALGISGVAAAFIAAAIVGVYLAVRSGTPAATRGRARRWQRR